MSVTLSVIENAFQMQKTTGEHIGRCLYKSLWDANKEMAFSIRDTDCDPYHNMENIDRFLCFLTGAFSNKS